MGRYVKLYIIFLKFSLVRMMENRFDFLFRAVPTTLTLIIALSVVSFIFSNVKEVAGWNRDQLFLLLGTYNIVWGLFFGLFIKNLSKINRYVNKGDLDLFLTKPVNSQFLVSTSSPIDLGEAVTLLSGIVILNYALNALHIQPNFITGFLYLLLVIGAVILSYSIWFMIMTLSFWFGRLPELHETFLTLFAMNKYPVDIFNGSIKFIFIYFFPLAVMVTFPTRILLNNLEPISVVWSLTASLIFLIISNFFWNFALKHYSSASS